MARKDIATFVFAMNLREPKKHSYRFDPAGPNEIPAVTSLYLLKDVLGTNDTPKEIVVTIEVTKWGKPVTT